jgi:predicted nucleic acid-binding protein
MPKYVIGPDVALYLAEHSLKVSSQHQLLAPTLLRSQVLAQLFEAVKSGELTKEEADRRLNYVRGLKIRYLGDRVMQEEAWKLADRMGWPDTLEPEYFALTQLQADAYVTMDRQLARALKDYIRVGRVEELL